MPRTENAPSDFKLYKSLGSLIADYRRWRQMSQERLAESVGISVRELQYWEKGRRYVHIGNLHDLSEITGIPMQVCIALNANQPIWYSLQERRFGYSWMDVTRFGADDLFKYYEQYESEIFANSKAITTDKQIGLIISYHRDIYGTDIPLGRDVIKAASTILPDLNRIIFDSWGHHVGHHVCLPIKTDLYEQIKKQKGFRGYLTPDAISDIAALHEGVFFFYYFFAASVNVRNSIIINCARYLAKIEPKERYLLAGYIPPVTHAKQICINLGMKRVFSTGGGHQSMQTENLPSLYAIKLDVLVRRFKRLEALQPPK